MFNNPKDVFSRAIDMGYNTLLFISRYLSVIENNKCIDFTSPCLSKTFSGKNRSKENSGINSIALKSFFKRKSKFYKMKTK